MKEFKRSVYLQEILNRAEAYQKSCGSGILTAEHIMYAMLEEIKRQEEQEPQIADDRSEWAKMRIAFAAVPVSTEELKRRVDTEAHRKTGTFMEMLALDELIGEAMRQGGRDVLSADVLFETLLKSR